MATVTNYLIPLAAPLIAHAQVAEILLYEIGMQESLCERGKLSYIDRIELLWSLFNTCKAFLALRLQSTPHFEPRFLCISSYDFMYGFITCLKLTNLNDVPGWDLGHVRRDLRLGSLMEQLTDQMQSVIERREKGGFHYWSPEGDPYRRLIDLLHGLRGLLATVESTSTTRPQLPQQKRDQQKQQRLQQDEDRDMGDIVEIPTPSSEDTVRQASFSEPFDVTGAAAAPVSEAGEDVGNDDVMQTWEEAWSDMVFSVDDWGQSTSFAHDPPLPFGLLPS